MIKAIETRYRGYRFRSRLEARWAVCFDNLGINWDYEPEGFKLQNGEWYLPDFRINVGGKKAWVEIKGGLSSKFDDFDSSNQTPCDFKGKSKTDQFAKEISSKGGVVFLFGNIPDPMSHAEINLQNQNLFCTSYLDGSWASGAIILIGSIVKKEGIYQRKSEFLCDFYTSDMGNNMGQPFQKEYELDILEDPKWLNEEHEAERIWWPVRAYEAARSARFEHGETQ